MRGSTTTFKYINLQSCMPEDHSVALRNNVKLGVNVQVSYMNMSFKKREDTVLV